MDFKNLRLRPDSGVVIRYGKNLTNIEQDVDISGAAGGVVGWWRGGDPGAEETVYSDIIYADGYGAGSPVISVDFSGDYTEKPTAAALAAKAAAYIRNNKPQEPTVNITIDFVALWQTPEYEHIAPLERVRLCDTVHVMYPALGVNVESKVIRTKYNVLLERYEEIDLGQPRTNFAEMLTAKTEELIQAVPTRSMIQAAINHATSLITGVLSDPALDPHHLLDLQAVQFVYNTAAALQYEDMRGQLLPGSIAEDVEKVYPAAVIRNEAGDVESWDERRIIPGMLVLIQEQQKTIDSQAKKMAELEGRIARLEKLLGMN